MEQGKTEILLVDDDPDVLGLFRMVLEHAGHSVIAVGLGESAARVLQTFICTAIVTDYHLPDTRGDCLITQAKVDQPGIVTMLISADMEVESLASRCGADAWYRKGEALQDFLAKVENALIVAR